MWENKGKAVRGLTKSRAAVTKRLREATPFLGLPCQTARHPKPFQRVITSKHKDPRIL
jgi:hypothetical protein